MTNDTLGKILGIPEAPDLQTFDYSNGYQITQNLEENNET
jgi:hypothetical protein